jgi:hypothetical protein
MSVGIADELAGIELGDKRRNKRSLKVIEALAANPEASVNAATTGWADTQAAYRLFDNPDVSPEAIQQPHRRATECRISGHPVVLIVQDTTELDYTDHPTRDALCLNHEGRFGFYHHVQLAITPQHLPLGVIATKNFDRAPETLGKKSRNVKLPIEVKESFRWLEGYREACQVAAACPNTRIVCVCDSEADIYDIFVDAAAQPGPRADYLIRAYENRSLPELDRSISRRTYRKVRDAVAASPERVRYTHELTVTPKREARTATLVVRAISVTVKPPNDRPHLPRIQHNVIVVEEVEGPGDGTDVSWTLLTTLPIETLEDLRRAIDYYVARWGIETYFRTLKTGCRVERIQLETKARLLNCLAFYNIIAWRTVYLTHLNRVEPDQPCTEVFADHEWEPVWRIVKKKPLPKQPPTLGEFMRLIAHLGGYNNRRKEKPPGPQPIWTGLRRMLDYSTAWVEFMARGEESCV